MTASEKKQLMANACKVRMGVIESTYGAKSGHPGGSLSASDLFTYLYFREMKVDPADPKWEERDRFVLSKGHTAPGLYAALALKEAGISARIINMATIKPLDEELVLKAAQECGKIITCEEHSVIGGLGEAVCALLSEKRPTLVRRIGVNDEFGHSGPAADLLKQFGLSAEHIVEVAKDFCGK